MTSQQYQIKYWYEVVWELSAHSVIILVKYKKINLSFQLFIYFNNSFKNFNNLFKKINKFNDIQVK